MPTTEWLNKYEAIKDKLTCKDDLEAHFTEKVIGNMAVDVLDIGAVHFPTGQIFACDPLVELEERSAVSSNDPRRNLPVEDLCGAQRTIRRPLCLRQGGGSQESLSAMSWAWWATRIWTRNWERTSILALA